VAVPRDPQAREALERRIREKARSFDLRTLVQLLVSEGYARESLLFQGNPEGGATSIVHDIEFRTRPTRTVLVTVNLGLLGDNALLPSYFIQEVEKSRDPDKFYDFIRFFDHRLISNYLAGVFPEDDPVVYPDYRSVQQAILRMSGFASVATLTWVGQAYFPELRVRVQRGAFARSTESHAFRTGESLLDGTGVLGRFYQSDAAGFVLELVAEEETNARGRSWAALVRRRLNERLLPVLAPFRLPLMVRLRVLHHASWARLDRPSAEESGYLGYDRIRGDADDGHSVVLFAGTTGAEPADRPDQPAGQGS
jgi:hypothetical protein